MFSGEGVFVIARLVICIGAVITIRVKALCAPHRMFDHAHAALAAEGQSHSNLAGDAPDDGIGTKYITAKFYRIQIFQAVGLMSVHGLFILS